MIFLLLNYMCKYCIVTMDWTSRISYVHTGQYYYSRNRAGGSQSVSNFFLPTISIQ